VLPPVETRDHGRLGQKSELRQCDVAKLCKVYKLSFIFNALKPQSTWNVAVNTPPSRLHRLTALQNHVFFTALHVQPRCSRGSGLQFHTVTMAGSFF